MSIPLSWAEEVGCIRRKELKKAETEKKNRSVISTLLPCRIKTEATSLLLTQVDWNLLGFFFFQRNWCISKSIIDFCFMLLYYIFHSPQLSRFKKTYVKLYFKTSFQGRPFYCFLPLVFKSVAKTFILISVLLVKICFQKYIKLFS